MTNPFPRQLILGHRGSPREALENTLRSFDLALQEGADGVELDVQRSRDGVPIVIHDDTLDRTMAVGGRVAKLDWPAIERLTGAETPSLDQAIAWAAAAAAWLNIEIKAEGLEEGVVERVEATGIGNRVVISSFDARIVRRVGILEPRLLRFQLTEHWDERAIRSVDLAGAQGVCLRRDAAGDAALDDLERRGLPVIVWTVNDGAEIRRLLERGAAAIITDLPGMAARIRAET